MIDKATLTLEYWVAGDELTRRGTVVGDPNPLEPAPQPWLRAFAAAAEGEIKVSPYRASAAFAAEHRFFEPGAERFFALSPRIAASAALSSERVKTLGYKYLLVRFVAELEFEGGYGGTRFWAGHQNFELLLTNAQIGSNPEQFITGAQGAYLFVYDRAYKDAEIGIFPAVAWGGSPLYEIAGELISRFDEPICELLGALPCFSDQALAARAAVS